MNELYLDKIDDTIRAIIAACFPSYKGRTVRLSTRVPKTIRSYWEHGTKYTYVFYRLADGQCEKVHTNHPFFEAGQPSHLENLPIGFLLVEHSYFSGKDMGIRIFANEADLAPMLPAPAAELTEAEKIVLTFTQSYKPAYRLDEAKRVHKITGAAWQTAKMDLIEKGLLNKAGAITAAGRNAISGKEVRHY